MVLTSQSIECDFCIHKLQTMSFLLFYILLNLKVSTHIHKPFNITTPFYSIRQEKQTTSNENHVISMLNAYLESLEGIFSDTISIIPMKMPL